MAMRQRCRCLYLHLKARSIPFQMKKLIIFMCLLLFFIQAQAQINGLPKVLLRKLDGSKIYASELGNHGKPFIISFWATWCKFCLSGLNTISTTYSRWREETGVKLIAISTDRETKEGFVKSFVQKRKWPYEIYIDYKKGLYQHFKIREVPHTLIIDNNGQILWQKIGFNPGDEAEIIQAYRQITSPNLNNIKHE